MATIVDKEKNGKVVSFKFIACLGRENGKKIYRTTVWKPPKGLSYAKARRMAEVEAYKWEQSLRGNDDNPHGELTSPAQEAAAAPLTTEAGGQKAVAAVEDICALVAEELRRQGLSDEQESEIMQQLTACNRAKVLMAKRLQRLVI